MRWARPESNTIYSGFVLFHEILEGLQMFLNPLKLLIIPGKSWTII